jgi:hypothetical protein
VVLAVVDVVEVVVVDVAHSDQPLAAFNRGRVSLRVTTRRTHVYRVRDGHETDNHRCENSCRTVPVYNL